MPAERHDERHKMITNSKEENSPPKLAAASSSASAATPWLRLKDPRIVRVSRAFGGKDRHSKVCTIRGLRDRRVRLSVSTAIQLYDLQDRLGLNQPSKVVDWLLNAAKDEIDELPPLPIPSASLGLNYQSMLLPHTQTHLHRPEFKINNCNGIGIGIGKEAEDDASAPEQKQQKSNSNPGHPCSFSALLNNVSAPPFGYHWEASSTNNVPFFTTSQAEDLHNFNNVNLSLPSPLSLSTGSQFLEFNHSLHQNFLIQHPPNLHSINQPTTVRPFHFNMAPKFISQQKNNNGDHHPPNKNDIGFGSDE